MGTRRVSARYASKRRLIQNTRLIHCRSAKDIRSSLNLFTLVLGWTASSSSSMWASTVVACTPRNNMDVDSETKRALLQNNLQIRRAREGPPASSTSAYAGRAAAEHCRRAPQPPPPRPSLEGPPSPLAEAAPARRAAAGQCRHAGQLPLIAPDRAGLRPPTPPYPPSHTAPPLVIAAARGSLRCGRRNGRACHPPPTPPRSPCSPRSHLQPGLRPHRGCRQNRRALGRPSI